MTTAKTRNKSVVTSILPSIAVLSSQCLNLRHVGCHASKNQPPPTVPVKLWRPGLPPPPRQILRHCKAQANRYGFVYSGPNATRNSPMMRLSAWSNFDRPAPGGDRAAHQDRADDRICGRRWDCGGTGILGASILVRQRLPRAAADARSRGAGPAAGGTGAGRRVPGAGRRAPHHAGIPERCAGAPAADPADPAGVARWGVKQLVKRAQVQFKAPARRIDGRARGRRLAVADRRRGPIIEGEFERLGEQGTTGPHRRKDGDRL